MTNSENEEGFMKEPPPTLVGVAVLLRVGRQVLLGKRKKAHGAGTWSVPGGHVDPGETLRRAAARELEEETGAVVDEADLVPVAFTDNLFPEVHRHYVTCFYEVPFDRLKDPRIEVREPEKCEEWRWFLVDKLPSPLFSPMENLLQGNYRFR